MATSTLKTVIIKMNGY